MARLCCPHCGRPLELKDEGGPGTDVRAGLLWCACGGAFPIRDGIPRFVSDEAAAASFGFQWTRFARTQLDSANGRAESRETFVQKTGLDPAALRGRRVLDVGCGMGRFLEVAAGAGAAEAVGIDMTRAVDAAQANLAGHPNAHLVQADLFHLPFAAGCFDVIYSIGVLHHTPDTRAAFLRLPRLLAPGGTLAVWVYSRHPRQRLPHLLSDLYRLGTTRMRPERLLALCGLAMPLGRLHRVPGLRWITYPLVPTSTHPDPEWRVLDTFDWYAPAYQWKHTYAELLGWFREAGLEAVRPLPVPVAATGRRPG